MSKTVNILAFILGLGLLVGLVFYHGLERTGDEMAQIGWRIIWPCLCAYAMMFCGSICWYLYIEPGSFKGNILHLYLANLAGQAMNQLTPTAGLGGEAIKGTLLAGRAKSEVLASSLIQYNVCYTAWSAVLVIAGPIALMFNVLPKVTWEERMLLFGIGLLCFLPVIGLLWLVQRGAVKSLFGLIRRLRLPIKTEKLNNWAHRVDHDLRDFKNRYPKRHFWAQVVMVLNRIFSILEVWAILLILPEGLLTVEPTLSLALVIMSVSQIIAWVFAAIPAQMGVLEGMQGGLFKYLGIGTVATGVGMEFVRRARKLILNIFGLLCMVLLQRLPGPSVPEIEEANTELPTEEGAPLEPSPTEP